MRATFHPNGRKVIWPKREETGDADLWRKTVESFRSDLEEMKKLINDPTRDLFAKIAHGTGQTTLREALLVADHNSYHLGVLLAMGRLLAKD